jgi:hypothetical protein
MTHQRRKLGLYPACETTASTRVMTSEAGDNLRSEPLKMACVPSIDKLSPEASLHLQLQPCFRKVSSIDSVNLV